MNLTFSSNVRRIVVRVPILQDSVIEGTEQFRALWHCPNSTVALRLLENVVKVTNLEVVKIEFRHLPFHLLLLSSSDSLAP